MRTKPREAAENAYTYVGHSTSFDFSAPDLAPSTALSLVAPIVCGLSVYAEHAICVRTQRLFGLFCHLFSSLNSGREASAD